MDCRLIRILPWCLDPLIRRVMHSSSIPSPRRVQLNLTSQIHRRVTPRRKTLAHTLLQTFGGRNQVRLTRSLWWSGCISSHIRHISTLVRPILGAVQKSLVVHKPHEPRSHCRTLYHKETSHWPRLLAGKYSRTPQPTLMPRQL